MKIETKSLLTFLVIWLLYSSCTILNKTRINSKTKFVKYNPEFIKECAAFSIEFALNHNLTKYAAKDIKDKKLRNKILSLGENVYVNYFDNNSEIPDSNVTFSSLSLFYGFSELIYDFATNKREFSTVGSNKTPYYFGKVIDRIYFRRRPIPMM